MTRTAGLPPAARLPTQERSRLRFEALLTATGELLAERDMREIGIYDIARQASVPAASAYHFFPKPEVAFLELGRRHLEALSQRVQRLIEPAELKRLQNWPDFIALRLSRLTEYYNSNPVVGVLFLSGSVISEVRKLDNEFTAKVSSLPYHWLNQYLVMPYLPQHELKFATVIAIQDGIWMLSYARHGHVTDSFRFEALAASVAYCRTFLPDVVPLRPVVPEQEH